jgi:short subunit dehydrogenase-like uncharacterized protein
VIHCAGPFTRYGEPVVRAAVETGTHYLDITGEQRYMQRLYDRYDEAARAAEVAVIPGAGFDYVPGDLACRLAARDLEPAREVVVGYWAEGVGVSRGSLHSVLEVLRARPLEYREGRWEEGGRAPGRARFRFPAPIGEQPVLRYPSGEVLTVPRHTEVRNVRSLIALGPLARLADLAPVALPAVSLALHSPLRPLLDLVVDRLPAGPAEEARRGTSFAIVALARGENGRDGRAIVRGTDVYGLTAVIAVHAAALASDPGFGHAGALSPAAVFDPTEFLDHLGDHGVTFTVDAPAREPAA